MLAQLTSYVADVRARLLWQYRKARIAGMLEVFAGQAQELENALWDLILQTSIGYYGLPDAPPPPPGQEGVTARASGIFLDWLGARVGELRQDADDSIYATQIAARVRANRSKGTTPDLIGVVELAAGGILATAFSVQDFAPAGVEIDLGNEVAHATAERVVQHVRRARAAGVGVMVIHAPDNAALTFTFSSTSAIEVDVFQGFKSPTEGGTFAGAHRA